MKARDYQVEFCRSVMAAWGDPDFAQSAEGSFRKVLGVLATSAGKTICAAILFDIITKSGGRPLFMGDTDELCQQPLEKIHKATGIICGLEKASDYTPMSADAVVSSLQTLSRPKRLERFPKNHFTHIIIDEAHRNVKLHQRVVDYFSEAKILGLTATDFRAKMKDLSAYYEYVAYRLETFDLVDMGYIPPVNVMTLPISIDISKVKESKSEEGKDYDATELDSVIKPFYNEVCKAIKEHCTNRRIVAFLPLIKSSQEFVSVCQENGISAVHVDGKSADRSEITKSFEMGRFQLISNSQLLTTGWDCPPADCLLNLRPTKSAGLFRQMAGRVIRVLPGVVDGINCPDERKAAIAASAKPNALILDLLWQTEKFGLAGAASLIANNDADNKELEARIRKLKDPAKLQDMMAEFQREKEDILIKQLEAAAKRKAMFVDARAIAAMLHQPELMDYEPVMSWESKKPSPKQLMILEKNGIDTTTVETRGHASKLLDLIFSRKSDGLISIPNIKILMERGVEHPEKMTDADVMESMGIENMLVGFGKHADKPLSEVPRGYWTWFLEQENFRKSRPILWKYAQEKLGRVEATSY